MKPTPTSPTDLSPLLVFGAHPDDIEFACGGLIAKERRLGRIAHFVVCSKGESGSHGTPAQRLQEADKSASLLGATVEFVELGGDAHLEIRVAHALTLAAIIRRLKPGLVLAPSLVENQHPDHWRLGRLIQDAARLARYGGVVELRSQAPHTIGHLLFYAITPEAEPDGITPVLIDISETETIHAWTAAMEAHSSQVSHRKYIELQIARARTYGLGAGVEYAIRLFPNDSLLFDSLNSLSGSARRF